MKKWWKIVVLAVCLALALPLVSAGCGGGKGDDPLVGNWADKDGLVEYEFTSDGTMLLRFMGQEEQTTYTTKDGKISVLDQDTGEQHEVEYTVDGDTLTLNLDGEEQTVYRKDKSAGTADQSTLSTEQADEVADVADMSATELGDAAVETWVEAMQELTALLADNPEAAAARSQVEQLKEKYVQKLLDLGRQREALDDAGKSEMNARIASALNASFSEDWYEAYMDVYSAYSSGDVEFANLLASFNILTQYADFDLLKQQAPDEAARLGVE